MTDAAVYLWAASQRCGRTSTKNPMCTIDIASATQASSEMVMVIVKATQDCGAIHSENYECGMAIGGIASAAAGLAAGTAGIAEDCPAKATLPPSTDTFTDRMYSTGKCVGAAASMGSALAGSVTDCQSIGAGISGNRTAKCV